MKKISIILITLLASVSYAQNGKLVGTVYDGEFNDVLGAVNITVEGQETGTSSDFEGTYSLNLPVGTHTVNFSYVGYDTVSIENVVIEEDKVTELDVTVYPKAGQLEEVVIKTTRSRNTESAILRNQKNAVNLMDGISAQTFKKIGVSNVANAVRNVPGVSVQNGRYVYVRGLGDRYIKTVLNGVDIPGLDPDRNTIQMDIFPTNILKNVTVLKSATADLPADFTGGIVNIATKDFPTKLTRTLSVSGTYNPDMHFNSNFLKVDGSGTDFLGFDDGLRDLPIARNQAIPGTFDNDPTLTELTQRLNPELAASRASNGANFSLGFTIGNQYDVGKDDENSLGYFASVAYRNGSDFFENFERGQYQKYTDDSIYELRLNKRQVGPFARQNVLLSTMGGLAYKKGNSKFKLNIMHLQNGESRNLNFIENVQISDAVDLQRDVVEYTQRSITNFLLNGKHANEDNSWIIEWNYSPSFARVFDKDIRSTAFEIEDNGTFVIRPSSSGFPERIWRTLEEANHVAKLDFDKKHTFLDKEAKLQFGAQFTFKQRDYGIDNIRVQFEGPTIGFNGDPNALLADENIWTVATDQGAYVAGAFQPNNQFNAITTNYAAYISEEFKISDRLKSIIGLRFEKFDLYYEGFDTAGTFYRYTNFIDKADLFPSANFIYTLTEKANLRASYARTTARPSFKEASEAQIADPRTSITFIGNSDIQPTYINNIDLRYERYGEGNELIALSAFYKSFKDPIELSFFAAATDQFTPLNLGDAQVFGVELELRKNLAFLSHNLSKFSFKSNVSIIESRQKFSADERLLRENTLREGETLDDHRQLQGQSPYLINVGVNYDDSDKGLQAGLFYNVQGKTLEVVGTGFIPDVFTSPFNSLNFNLNKTFGKDNAQSVNLRVTNILGDDIESVFESFRARDQIYSLRSPGRNFTIGYNIKF